MATKEDVVTALTDWLCNWVDGDSEAIRKQIFFFKNSIGKIDERDIGPFTNRIMGNKFEALKSFGEKLANIGLIFLPTDTLAIRATQAANNSEIGRFGLDRIREVFDDFYNFAMTQQFNASQLIANLLGLIRMFSRTVLM